MNPFVFQSPTKVLFGEFTTSSCGDVLADLGGRKALVVADAFLIDGDTLTTFPDSLVAQAGEEFKAGDYFTVQIDRVRQAGDSTPDTYVGRVGLAGLRWILE